MATYSFTCPLEGCHQVLVTQAQNIDAAAVDLTAKAERHLQEVHPDVHKTHEEVDQDIRLHMVSGN